MERTWNLKINYKNLQVDYLKIPGEDNGSSSEFLIAPLKEGRTSLRLPTLKCKYYQEVVGVKTNGRDYESKCPPNF